MVPKSGRDGGLKTYSGTGEDDWAKTGNEKWSVWINHQFTCYGLKMLFLGICWENVAHKLSVFFS